MVFFESLCLNIGIVFSICISFLYLYFTRTFTHWKNKGVIFQKPSPIFGNYKEMLLMQKWIGLGIQDIYNLFPKEPFVGIFQSSKPVLLVRDPDLIKQIMVKDFQHFQDRAVNNDDDFIDEPIRRNLINMTGAKWKQLRHKLTPTFTSGKLKAMFNLLVECGVDFEKLLTKMADGNEFVEMRELSAKYTTQVIGSVAFGIEMNSINDPKSEFRTMGRKIFEANAITMLKFYARTVIPKNIKKFISLQATPKNIEEFFTKTVKEVVEHRKRNNIKRNDFMQLLIQLQDQGYVDSKSEKDSTFVFDDALLVAQAFIFFLAGFETSSTAMSFILYELAVNPDIQRKVQEEIDEVMQKYEGHFTYDAALEMKYLDQVISEGLRKYPPVGVLARVCTLPYLIPGSNVSLDVGDTIQFPVYALHHDPRYYPNPSKFDPERFSEDENSRRHPFTYLPFGEGPRVCIGLRFAKLQTAAGLVSILNKFSVSPCPKTDIPLKFDGRSLILQSTNGIWLDVNHRK